MGTTYHYMPLRSEETPRKTEWGCKYGDGIWEHLCRDCGNCGYSWPEALAADDTPKDAPLKALPGGKE